MVKNQGASNVDRDYDSEIGWAFKNFATGAAGDRSDAIDDIDLSKFGAKQEELANKSRKIMEVIWWTFLLR